jgi:hypothetical protein
VFEPAAKFRLSLSRRQQREALPPFPEANDADEQGIESLSDQPSRHLGVRKRTDQFRRNIDVEEKAVHEKSTGRL